MSGDAPLVGIPEDMPRLLESDPDLPDELIDRILDGQPVDASAPLEAHLLAEWVATLRSAAQQSELRGEPSAVAAFLWAKRSSPGRGSSQRQLHPSVRKGIAGAAIVGAISAGGVVAAATGSLPAPLQVVAQCSSESTRRRRTTLVATSPQAATLPPRCQPTCSNRFPTSRRRSVPRRRVHPRTRPPVSPTCGPRQTRWPLRRRTHTAQPASPRPRPPTRHRRRRSRRVGRPPAWSRRWAAGVAGWAAGWRGAEGWAAGVAGWAAGWRGAEGWAAGVAR